MSPKLMYKSISRMHTKLNALIEKNHFDLQCDEVQKYSQRLDRVLTHFNNVIERNHLKITKSKCSL